MSYIIRPGRRRKQIINNLLADIIINEKISMNYSYVKNFVKVFSKLVNWAKKGDLHSRRLSLKYLHSFSNLYIPLLPKHQDNLDANLVKLPNKLFINFAERYKNRNGGYLKIIHLGKRRGDGSELALVSLV